MDVALLVARLALAVVFGMAGAAKVMNLPASRKAVREFGVPASLAPALGTLLPFAELAVAALLIPTVTAWWGAFVGLVLLIAFITAMTVNVVQGRTPDCHCFGQIHSHPIGWSTVARNAVLAGLAAVIVFGGQVDSETTALEWFSQLSVLEAVALVGFSLLSILLIIETWLVFHVFKQHGRLLLRMDDLENKLHTASPAAQRQQPTGIGLPVGSVAPSFTLPTLSGGSLTLDAMLQGHNPIVLLFSDPKCGPCTALMPEVGRWQREYAETLRIAIVSRGAAKAHRTNAKQYVLRDVLLQNDREVAVAYQAHGTPAAVLIRPDGQIGSPVVMGSEAITNLISHAIGRRLPDSGAGHPVGKSANDSAALPNVPRLRIGDKPPAFDLVDLRGKKVPLTVTEGNTFLLFWNPACGFCQRMLPDLKAWERQRQNGAPKLIVVSTGTAQANQAMGLEALVLLDSNFSVGRQFGAGGTPSAVLIDSDGRIASDVAVGAVNVLALGARPPNPADPLHETMEGVQASGL